MMHRRQELMTPSPCSMPHMQQPRTTPPLAHMRAPRHASNMAGPRAVYSLSGETKNRGTCDEQRHGAALPWRASGCRSATRQAPTRSGVRNPVLRMQRAAPAPAPDPAATAEGTHALVGASERGAPARQQGARLDSGHGVSASSLGMRQKRLGEAARGCDPLPWGRGGSPVGTDEEARGEKHRISDNFRSGPLGTYARTLRQRQQSSNLPATQRISESVCIRGAVGLGRARTGFLALPGHVL